MRPSDPVTLPLWQFLKKGQAVQKALVARRRPKVAREAYFLYVERATEGANEANGPFSAARPFQELDAYVVGGLDEGNLDTGADGARLHDEGGAAAL